MVLKELLLVQGVYEVSQLEKENLLRWGCHIPEVMLWFEQWEIHQFSCRHS